MKSDNIGLKKIDNASIPRNKYTMYCVFCWCFVSRPLNRVIINKIPNSKCVPHAERIRFNRLWLCMLVYWNESQTVALPFLLFNNDDGVQSTGHCLTNWNCIDCVMKWTPENRNAKWIYARTRMEHRKLCVRTNYERNNCFQKS